MRHLRLKVPPKSALKSCTYFWKRAALRRCDRCARQFDAMGASNTAGKLPRNGSGNTGLKIAC
jgi:hypothetical protein